MMPQICSVPHCRGNCNTRPTVNVFKFLKDEVLNGHKWLAAIMREEFTSTKSSRVSNSYQLELSNILLFTPNPVITSCVRKDFHNQSQGCQTQIVSRASYALVSRSINNC